MLADFRKLVGGILVILVLTSCGRNSDELLGLPGLSGKYAAITKAFPGVVVVSDTHGGLCTGTVIGDSTVLTAAHCIDNPNQPSRVEINAQDGTVSVSRIVKLGNGTVESEDDLAILVTDEDVTQYTKGVKYSISNRIRSREQVTIVGAGCNDWSKRTGSGVIRAGTNIAINVHPYIETYTSLSSLPSSRGVTGDSNQSSACFGDSGGPLFVQNGNGDYEVAGVTHAGGSDGQYLRSQFTNVATHSSNRAFITSTNSAYDLGIDM